MVNYCDMAIAIDKQTYAEHALLKKVPALLTSNPYVERNNVLHWYFEELTDCQAESQEISHFFTLLEAMGKIFDGETTLQRIKHPRMVERFGCLALYDYDGKSCFGDPEHYGLLETKYIDCPARDAFLEKEAVS
jgi:hypothetical protein